MTRSYDEASGLAQAWHYVTAAQRLMSAAQNLERQRQASPDALAKSQAMFQRCSEFWISHPARALDKIEEYLMGAFCHKLAAACSMRAFRTYKKDVGGGSFRKEMLKQARDGLQKLEEGAGPAAARAQTRRSVETLLAQFGYAVEALEAFEKGQSMANAFKHDAKERERQPLPDVEDYATLTQTEALGLAQKLLEAIEKIGGKPRNADGDGGRRR